MTEWVKSLSVVCPEALCDQANHLAACVGISMEDMKTFNGCHYEDSQGNKYSVIQTLLKQVAEDKLGTALERPDFDTLNEIDLTAASIAQALMTFELDDVQASITCSYDLSLGELASACGLSQIIPELY